MWSYICPELLKAIDAEPESDVLMELLFSLAKCIETLGTGCLNPQSMSELLRILDKLLQEHFERAVERLEKRKDEDYDEVKTASVVISWDNLKFTFLNPSFLIFDIFLRS